VSWRSRTEVIDKEAQRRALTVTLLAETDRVGSGEPARTRGQGRKAREVGNWRSARGQRSRRRDALGVKKR
jgi:hypothetical protein